MAHEGLFDLACDSPDFWQGPDEKLPSLSVPAFEIRGRRTHPRPRTVRSLKVGGALYSQGGTPKLDAEAGADAWQKLLESSETQSRRAGRRRRQFAGTRALLRRVIGGGARPVFDERNTRGTLRSLSVALWACPEQPGGTLSGLLRFRTALQQVTGHWILNEGILQRATHCSTLWPEASSSIAFGSG